MADVQVVAEVVGWFRHSPHSTQLVSGDKYRMQTIGLGLDRLPQPYDIGVGAGYGLRPRQS